jgi:hypothetical protein
VRGLYDYGFSCVIDQMRNYFNPGAIIEILPLKHLEGLGISTLTLILVDFPLQFKHLPKSVKCLKLHFPKDAAIPKQDDLNSTI